VIGGFFAAAVHRFVSPSPRQFYSFWKMISIQDLI